MKHLKFLVPVVVALVAFLCFAIPLQAQSSSRVHMSPTNRSITRGNVFDVQVRVNAPAQGSVTNIMTRFDASALSIVRMTNAGSRYGNTSPTNSSPGAIHFYHNTGVFGSGPVGNNLLAFTVTFRALKSGRTTITPSGTVNGANATSGSSVITVNSPPAPPTPPAPNPPPTPPTPPAPNPPPRPQPQPQPQPRPQPRPTPTPSRPTTPTPTPSRTSTPPDAAARVEEEPEDEEELDNTNPALVISNIRTSFLYDNAELSWETNHPGTSTFTYGTSESDLSNEADVSTYDADDDNPQSFPSYSIEMEDLLPGTTYFYKISTDKKGAGAFSDTYEGSFTTKGYPVKVTVLQNDIPAANATISVSGHEGAYTTNSTGEGTFELKEGTYTISVERGNSSAEEEVTVDALEFENGGVPDTQEFTFNMTESAGGSGGGSTTGIVMGIIGGILGLLAVFWLIIVRVRRKKQQEQAAQGYSPIVIDDGFTPPAAGEEYVASTSSSNESYSTQPSNEMNASSYEAEAYDMLAAPASQTTPTQNYNQPGYTPPAPEYSHPYDQAPAAYDPNTYMPPSYPENDYATAPYQQPDYADPAAVQPQAYDQNQPFADTPEPIDEPYNTIADYGPADDNLASPNENGAATYDNAEQGTELRIKH